MRLLKKFNQYMLENHPLTWHSKFIQLMIAGLLFWLISYICGYMMVNLGVIKAASLWNYYSRSNFVSFHVIYCLIVVCFWAIYFYKNNAIKSFYPLQRFYLVRLFLQLFIAFSLLVSADYPFTAGCFAKARSILPKETFEKDMDAINLGSVFLIKESNKSAYRFSQRKDLAELNYQYISFDEKKDKWQESFEYYYYPELTDAQYVPEKLPYRNFVMENDSTVTMIDGKKYLFFSVVEKYTNADSCTSIFLVDEIHKLDLKDLHHYAFKNYEGSGSYLLDQGSYADFKERQLPKIHRWTDENQKDSIEKAISGLMEACRKYKVSYDLNPSVIATYLQAKNYNDVKGFISNYSSDKIDFARKYPEDYAMILKYSGGKELEPGDSYALIMAMEQQHYFYYEIDRLDQMTQNYEDATERYLFSGVLPILYLSFFMAWLFIFFEFANIISLLISIPIGGVLSILVGIAMVYINLFMIRGDVNYNYDSHKSEKFSAAIIFCVCLVILLVMLYGLFNKRFNKKVLNVLINLSYVIAPMFISLSLSMLNVFSGHTVYGRCYASSYEYSYSFLLEPGFHLIYAFIGVFAIFPLIIKWRAREE